MPAPVYVLGTGLSHDGSSCLLKNGKLLVAIEKERLTRRKHDGGNDSLTVQYCLDYAGITINDLALVVQAAHFEKDSIRPDRYNGPRLFTASCTAPIVTISHHLAHAYSAIGTCPFDSCNVMVIDGSGSFYDQCDDLSGAFIPTHVRSLPGAYAETNSFYFFNKNSLQPLYKDFSLIRYDHKPGEAFLPTTRHSIGGLYAMASHYCFGDLNDAGKLMGLAPYGRPGTYTARLFTLRDGSVWVNEDIMKAHFTLPAHETERPFHRHFQYYADMARWVQDAAEEAILYLFRHRLQLHPHENICYAGGVALNAVANAKIRQLPGIGNLYMEPAAGDNGLAIGCAYYGWLQVLQQQKITHSGTTALGRPYTEKDILPLYDIYPDGKKEKDIAEATAPLLAQGKTIGWFQSGAEFGPRALGRRSILADPRLPHIRQHINRTIKLREDFRPFAPAVLGKDCALYFEHGWDSPYMILIDRIKKEWKDTMPGIVHVDGTCRVQTVNDSTEPFYHLLQAFKKITGIGVLLNTSLNRKGMPIVETPAEALQFFRESNLDALVINDHIFIKPAV